MTTLRLIALAVFGCLVAACVDSGSPPDVGEVARPLRSLTNQEARDDFDQMVSLLRGLYAPMQRKEERYGFSFEALASEYAAKVAAATTEAEYKGLFRRFLAGLHDDHVYLDDALDGDDARTWSLPLHVSPIENTFVVDAVEQSLPELELGDELLSIDGVPTATLVAEFANYIGSPNEHLSMRWAADQLTSRPAYLRAAISKEATVTLRLKRANGEEYELSGLWTEQPSRVPDPVDSMDMPISLWPAARELAAIDAASARPVSGVMTQQIADAYHVRRVLPSYAALADFDVSAHEADVASDQFPAYTYVYGGKTILLLRISTYYAADVGLEVSEIENYLNAVLRDQLERVDGLVIDETANLGGNVAIALDLARTLAQHDISGVVAAVHADRQNIQTFITNAQKYRSKAAEAADDETKARYSHYAEIAEEMARETDDAYSHQRPLTGYLPYFGDQTFKPLTPGWTKPFIVLVDESSVSASETFALLVQANELADVFGVRTAGGGGATEAVATLTNSAHPLWMTRSQFAVYDSSGTYPDASIIEDVGVMPNITHERTLADYRAGYVDYFKAFNDALSAKLPK